MTHNSINQNVTVNDTVDGDVITIGSIDNFYGTIYQYRQEKRAPFACNTAPDPPAYFAGRSDYLKTLTDALQTEEAVALTAVRGMGGIGKTTLAQKLAQDERFGVVLWAELGENYREINESTILKRWVQDLARIRLADDMKLADMRLAARDAVQWAVEADQCQGPLLLVLDDVWPSTISLADSFREVVQKIPQTRILVTSRQTRVISKLDIPPDQHHTLEALNQDEAMQMFINIINTPALTDGLQTEIRRVAQLLEGHPLALKLAANEWQTDLTADYLSELIALYDAGRRDGKPMGDLYFAEGDRRVSSVEVTLKVTLDNLGREAEENPKRRRQFTSLGALSPDAPISEAHLMVIWDEEDRAGMRDLLDHALLERSKAKPALLSQHRLLRAYARSLLRKQNELETVEKRHHDYLIRRARSVFHEQRDKLETWDQQIADAIDQVEALGNDLVKRLAQYQPGQ
ncbi:MAG: hypothetical protein GYB68_01325, partial [Chloroflexi bacterium]|nr:hypothetical protein [Chloroflexota bacterium]